MPHDLLSRHQMKYMVKIETMLNFLMKITVAISTAILLELHIQNASGAVKLFAQHTKHKKDLI